jgi:hypothetical protein
MAMRTEAHGNLFAKLNNGNLHAVARLRDDKKIKSALQQREAQTNLINSSQHEARPGRAR